MKNIFKKIIFSLLFIAAFASCDNEEDVNYTPKVYVQPSALKVEITNVTDTNFDVNFTATEDGVVYYSIQGPSSDAPTSESLIRGNTVNTLLNSKETLASAVMISKPISDGIYGAYTYSVYSVMTSVDGIASSIVKTDVTTPDTSDPMFLRDDSSPAFQSGGISPFTSVTFAFDEPVFYQGGNITFSGDSSGRVITVSGDAVAGSGTTAITINSHGTFAQDDFQIVTWGADTFKDNAGKSVAELSGFSHYFKTRAFTAPEAALLMVGTYNYETVFYGGLGGFYTSNAALFLPDTGEFELKLDPSDPSGTTLLGVNIFSPLNQLGYLEEPDNLKIKFGEGGSLAVLDEFQTSGIPVGRPVIWNHWSSNGTPFPGFYNVTAGTINHWVSLVFAGGSGPVIDDIDYNYTRIGTFSRSTPDVREDLNKKNELLQQKITKNKTYEKASFKEIK